MLKAQFQEAVPKTLKVICRLCPHQCVIPENMPGLCKARKNIKGTLYSLTYSKISSCALDPVEKKPLYHFMPGSGILSYGSLGCNFSCGFCQNWQISQASYSKNTVTDVSPEDAASKAAECGSIGIAYTYNEPLINFEWVQETAKKVRAIKLKNVLVTNGYINEEPIHKIIPYIDAANIDIKSFSNEFYKKYCGGAISAVLRSAEIMFKAGVHIELTTLLIPGQNDSEEEIYDLIDWVSSLNEYIPIHFSKYFPNYNYNIPPTSEDSLVRAKSIAEKKLKFVYIGNCHIEGASNTYCPVCRHLLIKRTNYKTDASQIKTGICPKCKTPVTQWIKLG